MVVGSLTARRESRWRDVKDNGGINGKRRAKRKVPQTGEPTRREGKRQTSLTLPLSSSTLLAFVHNEERSPLGAYVTKGDVSLGADEGGKWRGGGRGKRSGKRGCRKWDEPAALRISDEYYPSSSTRDD